MIKFSHTVFALPFALSAMVLAYKTHPISPSSFFWILTAMVGARSAAMGFNRIADARVDAKNPRTRGREIPAGALSVNAARIFVLFFSALFILAAGMLGELCLLASGPVLGILFFYSYTKRFTWLSHLYLGFAISLAPLGAWLALTDSFTWSIIPLSLALWTYIAGFDILYACQDVDFDRKEGLFSTPVRFGVRKAMRAAAVLHGACFCFLILIHVAFQMGPVYTGAVCLIGILLIIEHRLVKPDDLSRIHAAFFLMNSAISITLFFGILIDELAGRWI
ncbi:MAG: UbiA family prenyltransferase [Desulfobacterales bacterium]|nr:UbiA family prenyltransferase [Desulfobacterales bacterium]